MTFNSAQFQSRGIAQECYKTSQRVKQRAGIHFLRAGARLWCALAALVLAPAGRAQQAASGQQPTSTSKSASNESIVVTGKVQTYSSQLDRRSYAIGRDVQGATGSIADVLRNVPSVDVDLQGNVTLRGQPNVTILVDGKPSSLFKGAGGGEVLQQLPAGQFERVEVMTNPSAAFGSEGAGGIINLITRRNRRAALTGTIRANLGTSGRRAVGGSVSKRFGKLSLSANGSVRRDPQFSKDLDRFRQLDDVGSAVRDTQEVTKGIGGLHLWNIRAGADYDLDDATRVSAEFHHTSFAYESQMTSKLRRLDSPTPLQLLFRRDGKLVMDSGDSEGSLTYRRDFAGTEHNLIASFTVERTNEHNERLFEDRNIIPAEPPQFDNVTSRTALARTELKADYSRPLKHGRLQLGYDVEANNDLIRDVGGFGPDPASAATAEPQFSDLFKFRRAVPAAYATLESAFDPLTVEVGVRLELASTMLRSEATAFTAHSKDTRVFPSFHAEYALGKNDAVRASFAERITRPEASDLDPFRRFDDPFHFHAGNPALKPEITNSFEFGFERHRGPVLETATFYYRHNERGITDVAAEIADHVLLGTRENLKSNDSLGVELVANGNIGKKLSYRLSGNILRYRIDASNLGFGKRSAWVESGKASLDWEANAANLAQATISLTGMKLLPQGIREPMLLVNAGFRHRLSRRVWAFFTAQDAFHTYKQHDQVTTVGFVERTADSARTQAAFLGVTCNFGKIGRDPGFDYNG